MRVAAPVTSPAYNRDEWPHWIDADGDCQDTRAEVLIAESTVKATLSANGCTVVSGRWVDIYTGTVFTDPSQLDVDHMVPLADAHRSGGATWPTSEKQSYANDLGLADALVAVSASANRSKGDQSPDDWMPPSANVRCRYITDWIDVKYKWSLTVTSTEHDFLVREIRTC